jgi:hypothetical protein
MDEETRAEFAALRKQMSDQHERLINQIKSLSHDFQNTKGFLLNDALTLGQRIEPSSSGPSSHRPTTLKARDQR